MTSQVSGLKYCRKLLEAIYRMPYTGMKDTNINKFKICIVEE